MTIKIIIMVVIAISEMMGENVLVGRGLNIGEIKLVKLARSNQNGSPRAIYKKLTF